MADDFRPPADDVADPRAEATARRLANLDSRAAIGHGVWPLVQRGEIAPEFEAITPALEQRLAENLQWVGNEYASGIDRDTAVACARWTCAEDLLWSAIARGGLLMETRRKRLLLDQLERVSTRAAFYRRELRERRFVRDVTPPPTPTDYLRALEAQHGNGHGGQDDE
jgi:hypothetical protein